MRSLSLIPSELRVNLTEALFDLHLALSLIWGGPLGGCFYHIRALLFGVHMRAPDCWKLPFGCIDGVCLGVVLGSMLGVLKN